MKYFDEFRKCWQYLLASSLGMAAGYTLVSYVNNLFTPHLLDAFSWSRSDIALVGVAAFLGIVTQPVAGRLTDRFGVRRVAAVGVLFAPLIFVGFALMTGSIWQFFLLTFAQILVVGGTTSAVVYNRLVAQSFFSARGVAFAIAASSAPVAGALLAPVVAVIIDQYSWREGYLVLAVFTGVCGFTALALAPRSDSRERNSSSGGTITADRYGEIIRNPTFQLILVGFILCNFAFTMQTQHLKVILLDNGVSSLVGSFAISLFASSVIMGRLLCGIALDRYPSHWVATIAMGLPGVGLGLLATGTSETAFVFAAVLCVGVALGAEIDVLAYLVGRFFSLRVFSSVQGLLMGGLAFSVASGALILSVVLDFSGRYTAFLVFCSASALVGSFLFFMLRGRPVFIPEEGAVDTGKSDDGKKRNTVAAAEA